VARSPSSTGADSSRRPAALRPAPGNHQHLIREDERIVAGQVTLTDAPSPGQPVRTAAIDKLTINVISI
jgi:hypothetical protein